MDTCHVEMRFWSGRAALRSGNGVRTADAFVPDEAFSLCYRISKRYLSKICPLHYGRYQSESLGKGDRETVNV